LIFFPLTIFGGASPITINLPNLRPMMLIAAGIAFDLSMHNVVFSGGIRRIPDVATIKAGFPLQLKLNSAVARLMSNVTPDTIQKMVQARLIQTYRQYPRAGLQLSSSCRKRLLEAISHRVLEPAKLWLYIQEAADEWTLQAKLAFKDVFKYYQDAFQPGNDNSNTDLLRAISDGIRVAGDIPS
jgi:hypothetical protein